MDDGKLSINYFGISIRCSHATSLQLLRAILLRDARKIKDVINVGGANVNDLCRCLRDDDYPPFINYTLTPLSLAVRFSTNRIVRSLLQLGADPNVKCEMTPLGVAVQRNNKKLVALLLDSAADINLLTHPVEKWRSSAYCKDTYSDHLMQTPLHIACRKGFVDMTAYLLMKQAATDVIDGSGNMPADVARKYGHREIQALIFREVACRTLMPVFPTPCRYDKNIRFKTNKDNRAFTTHLIMACIRQDVKKASCFVSYGANVNANDDSSNTALHYACANGNQELVKLLLKNDAEADAVNEDEKCPIEVAMEYGYTEIVFILIEHNCVLPRNLLLVTNSRGNTLLHIACKQNRVKVVKQLIEQGGILNVANQKGKSPIHYAWQSRSVELKRTVVDYVFQYYKVKTFKGLGRSDVADAELFKQFIELSTYTTLCKVVGLSQKWTRSVGVKGEQIHGNLCSTCGKLTPDACYLLLNRGMPDIAMLLASCCRWPCEANCTTLLHIVCQRTEDRKTVQQLIELGEDVNAVDCKGNTPLHLICCRRSDRDSRKPIITTLLDNDAKPCIFNNNKRTALWYAFSINDSQLVQWMICQKKIGIDAAVRHGFNREENTLLLMLANVTKDELLWKLVDRRARINVPLPTTSAGWPQLQNKRLRKQPRLLNILARNNRWSLIRKLVEVGCCDFTTELFSLLNQPSTPWDSNEVLVCSRMQMLKWFLLAGLGWKCDEFPCTDTPVVENFCMRQFLSKYMIFDSEVSTDGEDDYDDNDEPRRALAVTKMKTKETLEWLKYEMENPTSLSRLCVYTIRRQLTYADRHGKSIFPAINQLPLPTRLKDSLKLRDIECDAECFNQQRIKRDHRFLRRDFLLDVRLPHVPHLEIVSNVFKYRRSNGSIGSVFDSYDFLDFDTFPLYRQPRRAIPFSWITGIHDVITYYEEITRHSEQPRPHDVQSPSTYVEEVTRRSEQPRPQKRYCTLRKVQTKPKILHSVRRSRTILQPRRHH